jgi:hypothetical protein
VKPPEIEITGGAPTPDEEDAVRAAILALWREDQAEAARAEGSRWTRVARAEAAGSGGLARGWRASTALMQPGILLARRVGRGDQR